MISDVIHSSFFVAVLRDGVRLTTFEHFLTLTVKCSETRVYGIGSITLVTTCDVYRMVAPCARDDA